MKLITLFLLLLAGSIQLKAVQKIAVVNNGDWSNPLTWGGSLPGNNDTIIIPAGITVDVDINSPTYTNMQVLVLGTLNFQSGQKINICPGGIYIAPGGSVSGGTPGSKINICGTTLWNGPTDLTGPASLGTTTLPVELLSFTGQCVEQKVQLEWVTGSETNNARFVIERSTNGLDFTEIGQVAGSGTTSQQHTYTFSDAITGTNTVYYRLRQVDFNGLSRVYQPIAIETVLSETGANPLDVYPNPCTDQCQIVLITNPEEESLTQVQLLDATGQQVSINVIWTGINKVTLDVASSGNLKSGVYIVKGISSTHIYYKKLVLN
ncbi:MAG: G8 domain-containing protein [Bacteroidia bacterium]